MRFTPETDAAHMAKGQVDWHRVWCGANGVGHYVDIHKFGSFGDRDYSWFFVYTIDNEVIYSLTDITDEQAKLPEQELKELAQGYVSGAVSKWQIHRTWATEVAEKRAAK